MFMSAPFNRAPDDGYHPTQHWARFERHRRRFVSRRRALHCRAKCPAMPIRACAPVAFHVSSFPGDVFRNPPSGVCSPMLRRRGVVTRPPGSSRERRQTQEHIGDITRFREVGSDLQLLALAPTSGATERMWTSRPHSSCRRGSAENLDVFGFELADDEMARIAALDAGKSQFGWW